MGRRYAVRKRVADRKATRQNELYVTTSSAPAVLYKRVRKVLDHTKYKEVVLYAMGPAIDKAVQLSLRLASQSLGALELRPTTSTVTLVDDLVPLQDNLSVQSKVRHTSQVRIVVRKRDQAAAEQPAVVQLDLESTQQSSTAPQGSRAHKRKRDEADEEETDEQTQADDAANSQDDDGAGDTKRSRVE